MRTRVKIRFDASDIPGQASAVFEAVGLRPDEATVTDVPVLRQLVVWLTLDTTDPRLSRLQDLLLRHGVDPLEIYRDLYTEEELDAAPLLVLQPLNTCSISGGSRYGTTYDLTGACPACGTGARQTSAVFVRGEQLDELEGRKIGGTVQEHVFVDAEIAEELVRIGATGLSFRSVYARMPDGRQIKLRWQQLFAEKTLPRMSPRTTGIVRDRECKVCDRNGYATTMSAPPRFVYRKADLQNAADVNHSWENCGSALLKPDLRESFLSHPWLLVTPRVRRVIVQAGATDIEWFPVRVEDG
ncbi:MAG: hypothetical protein U0441_05205 [Polyangiaceae bacterium]